AAVAHTDHFLDLCSPCELDRGDAPGHWQRRAGQEWKAHRVGGVDHLLGPVPPPREMLVVEDRHTAARTPEDVDDLLKELVTGIEPLAPRIARITAVLTDNHHAVDGELLSATSQRQGDRGIDGQFRMPGGAFLAQITRRLLIDV